MQLTENVFKQCVNATNAKEWVEIINSLAPAYGITTVNRMAGFLAQTGHETTDYKNLIENLNYSAKRLNEVFPKYFKNAGISTTGYANNPQALGNYVYANRMGNGSVASGDGYKFRGHGLIQLTGRSNLTNFGKTKGMTPDQAVEYAKTKQGAVEAAMWFWKVNNVNAACDADDIVKMTKIINGGDNGLADRKTRYTRCKAAIATLPQTSVSSDSGAGKKSDAPNFQILRRGSRGTDVRRLQASMGITADGIFGIITESSVKARQRYFGLPVDGIVNKELFDRIVK